MKALSLAVLLLLGSLSGAARVRADDDPWLGPDKGLHFGVSLALAAGGYGVSSLFLHKPWQRATAGAGFALVLGAGKELIDLAGKGDPSGRDFTWDLLGAATGVGIAYLIDFAVARRRGRRDAWARRAVVVQF